METASVPLQPRKRLGPWAMFSLGCGSLVFLLVMALVVVAFSWRYRVGRRVDDGLAKIREAGEPITPEELTDYCRLPDGVEDVTHLWVDATLPLEGQQFDAEGQGLPIVGDYELEIPPPGEPWPQLEAVEQYLGKYSRSLDQLHRAAEAEGGVRYSTDFAAGYAMLLPEVQRLRGGARLLALEAHVRAHGGDVHGAADSVHAIFRLAQSLEREPVLVSQLVRMAIDGIARDQLRPLLHSLDFSEEDLARFQEDVRGVEYGDGQYRSMLFERIVMMMVCEDPGSATGENIPLGPAWRLTQQDSKAFCLEHMADLIAATKTPFPECLERARQAEARLRKLETAGFFTKIRHMIPLLLAPALEAAFEATARNMALNGAADAAVACELYRRKHGELPETLEQLVPDFLPEVPIDPYTGERLKYLVREDEYVVYSVGRNGADESGLFADGFDGDHPFRVGPPEEAGEAVEDGSEAASP